MNIIVDQVNKTYVRNDKTFFAVQDVSLHLETGDFVTIVGKSGSGKSTLLNMLAGILQPASGTIRYDELTLNDQRDEVISQFRNQSIGYVGQGYTLLANLSVYDNIRFAATLYQNRDCRQEIENLLESLDITHLKNMYPKQLSGGEMRRASIARAFVNHPKVLLADEPTGDLDDENTKIVLDLFQKLAKAGTIVIVVTHDQEALAYANKRYEMKQGRLSEFTVNVQ